VIRLFLMVASLLSAIEPECRYFAAQARSPRLRSFREFAEQELIHPKGPFAGHKFKADRQPFTKLLLDEFAKPWRRINATGPTQSGKSWICFITPTLYHLFEIGESVICGVPNMDMARDKWQEDLLPAIECSRFRDLLPKRGAGSQGGDFTSIRFRNGAALRFMTGGGGDKSVAGYTARVLMITETDGMDEQKSNSRESDRISQLEARTRAYGSRKRVYMECTLSTEKGRTWIEYQRGTASRLLLPCPHCSVYVTPERDSLIGWQEAEDVEPARERSAFYCPACGQEWSEDDRKVANASMRLVHKGQDVTPTGEIIGDSPQTDTLGFRWSAVNNLFVTAGDIGSDEWRAARAENEDNAEREMCQFVWCLPHQPSVWDSVTLDAQQIVRRTSQIRRGFIPDGTEHITCAIDLGKWLCHWIAVAWKPGAVGQVVAYDRIEVASSSLGVERALLLAIRQFRDEVCSVGWEMPSGKRMTPEYTFIDSGYKPEVVYQFCRESGRMFMPSIGRGAGQTYTQKYNEPKSTGAVVKHIGEEYHISWIEKDGVFLVEVNADHWKSIVHSRLTSPITKEGVASPGSIVLHAASPQEHLAIAKHLTSEKQVEEFDQKRGTFTKWERVKRDNHWFDALYNACAAGHLAGVRVIEPHVVAAAKKRKPRAALTTPDGRPFFITERN